MSNKIPYTPRVQAQPAQVGGKLAYADASVYNQINRQLVASGRELQQLGGQLGNYAIQQRQEETATDLLAEKVQIEDNFREWQEKVMYQRKGVSARGLQEEADSFFEEQFAPLREKYKDRSVALYGVERMADTMRGTGLNIANRYQMQEEENYKAQLIEKDQASTINALYDPRLTFEERQAELKAFETELRVFSGQTIVTDENGNKSWQGGRNVDLELAKLQDSLHLGHIDVLLKEAKFQEARKHLKDNSKSISGLEYAKAQEAIKTQAEAFEKKAQSELKAQQEKAFQEDVKSRADNILSSVASFPTTEEGTVAGVKIINAIEDKEVRDAVRKQFTAEMGWRETIQKAGDFQAVQDYTKQAMNLSPTQQETWLQQKEYTQPQITAIREVQSEVFTDVAKQREILTPERREAESNIKILIDESRRTLAPLSREQVQAALMSKSFTQKQREDIMDYYDKGGNVGQITQTQLLNAYKNAYGQGKKSSNIPDEFYSFIQNNIDAGRVPTQDEVNRLASLYAMDGTTPDSGYFSDSETYIEAVENDRLDIWLPKVEDNEVAFIDAQLQNMGVTINDETRSRYKKQFMLDIEEGEVFRYE